jgi:hypothetical protein
MFVIGAALDMGRRVLAVVRRKGEPRPPGVEVRATRRRSPVPVKPPSDGVLRRAPKSQGQRLSRPLGQGDSGEDAACSLSEHGEVSEDVCPLGVVMRVPLVKATADDTPIYDQLRVDVEFWSIVGPPSTTGGASDE